MTLGQNDEYDSDEVTQVAPVQSGSSGSEASSSQAGVPQGGRLIAVARRSES